MNNIEILNLLYSFGFLNNDTMGFLCRILLRVSFIKIYFYMPSTFPNTSSAQNQ